MSIRIELKLAGFNELRNTIVDGVLAEKAAAIASAAGDGFKADPVKHGKTRAHVRVFADTDEAKGRDAEDHVLLRALDAGR